MGVEENEATSWPAMVPKSSPAKREEESLDQKLRH